MKSPITYYYDESLEKRVAVNESGQPVLDWGDMLPGQKREKRLYVRNDTLDMVTLRQPYTGSESLRIVDFPTRINPRDFGIVRLELTIPAQNDESADDYPRPHNTDWGFDVIIG